MTDSTIWALALAENVLTMLMDGRSVTKAELRERLRAQMEAEDDAQFKNVLLVALEQLAIRTHRA